MNRRPTMTLADVRRAIEAQDKQLAEGHERAKAAGKALPVTPTQLRRLSELAEVRVPAAPPRTTLKDWTALRC